MKKWLLSYKYKMNPRTWTTRSVVIFAVQKLTRSVAHRLALDDLNKNVIDHTHGQNGYYALHVTSVARA
jgi:hypothetical protein